MTALQQLTEASTSKLAQAGAYKVHYNEAGTGPAVIMLHGGGPGASGWSNFQRNIGPFAERHRTLLVDMLNFGKSDSVAFTEPAATVRARALRDLLDTLGVDRASFVGNSMGGSTAMTFAIDYPERTERLALMGAAGTLPLLISPMPTEGHKRLGEAARNPSMETMRALADTMLFDSSIVSDELLRGRVEAALNPAHRAANQRSANVPREIAGEVGRITARTLIIWGREDRVNPLEIGLRLLRDIPDSRLLVFKNCGHWAQFEHADEFNRVVLEFLAAP